jgi:hypothetical protein
MCAGSGLVQREHHRLGHILGRELVPLRRGDDGDAGLDWIGLCARDPALASCCVGGAAVPDLVSFIPAFAATDPLRSSPEGAVLAISPAIGGSGCFGVTTGYGHAVARLNARLRRRREAT